MRSANPGDPRHSPKSTQGAQFIADFCVFAKNHFNLALLLYEYNFPTPNIHPTDDSFSKQRFGDQSSGSVDEILNCTSMRTRLQVPSTYMCTKWTWKPVHNPSTQETEAGNPRLI